MSRMEAGPNKEFRDSLLMKSASRRRLRRRLRTVTSAPIIARYLRFRCLVPRDHPCLRALTGSGIIVHVRDRLHSLRCAGIKKNPYAGLG